MFVDDVPSIIPIAIAAANTETPTSVDVSCGPLSKYAFEYTQQICNALALQDERDKDTTNETLLLLPLSHQIFAL